MHKTNDEIIVKRQEEWIQCTITKYNKDQNRMYGLFDAINEHDGDRSRLALRTLLSLISDYSLFVDLPLEASSWGGMGSMIPYMQERIEYLTSILPLLSGIDYLRHRRKVEQYIEMWRNRIRREEIDELMRFL